MNQPAPDPLRTQYLQAGSPGVGADNTAAITHWLRKWLRQPANDLAVSWIADSNDAPAEDFVNLGPLICKRMNWPEQCGEVAVLAEYKEAKERVVKFLAVATPVVRRLAYEKAPGEQMMKAAKEIADNHGLFLPTEYVIAFCRRIAASTLTSRRGRGNSG